MMRARLALALTAVAIAVLVGCGSDPDGTRATEAFTSPTYGYTIEHPTSWSAIPAEHQLDANAPPLTRGGGTDIIGRRANRTVSKMQLPAVVIGAQAVTRGTTVDAWKAAVVEIVRSQKGCARPRSTERLTIGGDAAMLLDYPDCPKSSGLYHLWIAVVHGGRGYQIVWFNEAGSETRDRKALDDMLASLSFAA
jgi:hypothetical protein